MSRVAKRCAAVILVAGSLSAAATLDRASAVTTPDSATPATSRAATAHYTAASHVVYGGRDLVTLLEPTPVATPVPTPAPTPVPARVPAPRPAAVPHLATPAPAPVSHHDWLDSGDGSINTAVSFYTDCSGAAPIPANNAAIDTCWKDVTYFVGHNYGVFTPLLSYPVGATLTYWDSNGSAHPYRVVSSRDWTRDQPPIPKYEPDVVAQFQTCLTADGSHMRILDAVPA